MGFDIGLRAVGALLLTLAIKGGVALFNHSIGWGWAALIAFAAVFGGWLIIDGDVVS